jgi:small subunit ribosomal protein S16
VAVKIRLKRLGKMRAPYYRIVVMDARAKRDGRAIEEIGKYHPTEEPSFIEVQSERAQYWLGVGAQPTEQVAALLKITGDWQKYKGIEGQEGTLKTREPKAAFVAPEKNSVLIPEAITKKAAKQDDAPAEAETAEAE